MPRFMLLVKGDVPAGAEPSPEMIETMNKYNEELSKAGVLLDLSGLKPSSEGVRVQFSKGRRTKVIDGPFAESKELIGGYWIIDVKSIEEAVEWAKRAPMEPSPEFGNEEPVIERANRSAAVGMSAHDTRAMIRLIPTRSSERTRVNCLACSASEAA